MIREDSVDGQPYDDGLRCLYGEEVAAYHAECLSLVLENHYGYCTLRPNHSGPCAQAKRSGEESDHA